MWLCWVTAGWFLLHPGHALVASRNEAVRHRVQGLLEGAGAGHPTGAGPLAGAWTAARGRSPLERRPLKTTKKKGWPSSTPPPPPTFFFFGFSPGSLGFWTWGRKKTVVRCWCFSPNPKWKFVRAAGFPSGAVESETLLL